MMFVAEKYLNLTQEEVGRLEADRAADLLRGLMHAARRTPADSSVDEEDEVESELAAA